MIPETRYAQVGDRQVAYQVVGDGPIDLLVVPPVYVPIDLMWEEPTVVRFIERLSSFTRSIWFDSWGNASSSRLPQDMAMMVEAVSMDMVGVLDAAAIEQTAVLDVSGGWASMLFAASHPERMKALVLHSPTARLRLAPDYPEGLSDDQIERRIQLLRETWGTGAFLRVLAPSVADDARFVRWWAKCERLASPPNDLTMRWRAWHESDMRDVLPTIKVPTLVLLRKDRGTRQGEYVAEHIPGARAVETLGEQLFFTGETGPTLDAIEEFLTGKLPLPVFDRVLATVLFTDIIGSTERAASLGDRAWSDLLAAHDSAVRGELARHRGREVKSTGDGFLATFDGPGRAVICAAAIRDAVRPLGIDVRVGAHTGEVELQGDHDIGGIAVHIAQRVMAEAGSGEIVVSSTVKDLVAGSGIVFHDRGLRDLKGVPEQWRLYAAAI